MTSKSIFRLEDHRDELLTVWVLSKEQACQSDDGGPNGKQALEYFFNMRFRHGVRDFVGEFDRAERTMKVNRT